MSSASFKDVNKMCLQIIYVWYVYKQDLAFKTSDGWYAMKPNQTKSL